MTVMMRQLKAPAPVTFEARPLQLVGRQEDPEAGVCRQFRIEESNIPEPYDVYWKIRNRGEEVETAGSLRGDIHEDSGNRNWTERTSYIGHHHVEAMIVKEGTCVAKSRQDVIVV